MDTVTADARPRAHLAHLLHLDPELGESLREDARRQARARLVAPVVELSSGDFDPAEVAEAGAGAFALMVSRGLVVREVELAGTPSAALLGPGDLLPHDGRAEGLLTFGERWRVSSRATVAILDERLLPGLQRWPSLGACLVVRAARQAARAAEHRAIAQLPRVDLRLRALLWHLADRWGRVGAGGVVLPLELTHDALGRLVGARRPTVTLALGELVRDGLVVRRPDGAWVLPHGTTPGPATPPRPPAPGRAGDRCRSA
jgi:CRP/FNR family transcriptional regulator, cyclic AMP receptor protein